MISMWRIHRFFGDNYHRLFGVTVPSYVYDVGCLFIHIPKVAGISISYSLYGREIGHTRLSYYRDIPDDLHIFSVVRNPFERVVSAWRFLSQGGLSNHPNGLKFNDTVLRNYDSFDSFVCNWLSAGNEYSFLHFIPQSEFLKSRDGSLSRINCLLRFETLENDYKTILNNFPSAKPLIPMNSSGKFDYRTLYTSRSYDCIRNLYAEDFHLLDYDDSFFL